MNAESPEQDLTDLEADKLAWIEGDLPAEAAAALEARLSADELATLQAQRTQRTQLQQLPVPALPEDLSGRILDQLDDTTGASPAASTSRRPLMSLISLTGALAAGLGLVLLLRPLNEQPPQTDIAASISRAAPATEASAETPSTTPAQAAASDTNRPELSEALARRKEAVATRAGKNTPESEVPAEAAAIEQATPSAQLAALEAPAATDTASPESALPEAIALGDARVAGGTSEDVADSTIDLTQIDGLILQIEEALRKVEEGEKQADSARAKPQAQRNDLLTASHLALCESDEIMIAARETPMVIRTHDENATWGALSWFVSKRGGTLVHALPLESPKVNWNQVSHWLALHSEHVDELLADLVSHEQTRAWSFGSPDQANWPAPETRMFLQAHPNAPSLRILDRPATENTPLNLPPLQLPLKDQSILIWSPPRDIVLIPVVIQRVPKQ